MIIVDTDLAILYFCVTKMNGELAKKSTSDGESCLHLTAISNSVDIAKLMIEHGTNVNLRVTHPLVS